MLGRGDLKPKTGSTDLLPAPVTEPVVLRTQEPRVVIAPVMVEEKEGTAELPAGTSIPVPGVAIPQAEGVSTTTPQS